MATRREKVVLDLEDRYTPGMARAAAATAALNRELNSLSGQSLATARSSQTFVRDVDNIGRAAKGADGSINQLTGRLRVLGEAAAVLGPSLTPIGGVALAGIGGLANQMGIAAVAGGVLIGSLQGVGDALGAMNKAQVDPTVKNLEAAEDALRALSPAARDFAREAFALKPALVALRDLGAESLLPGLTQSLDSLEELGPRVGGIMQAFGDVLGDIASDSAGSLASDRWADFFRFIEVEGPATMSALATTVGDLTHGFSELWTAFAPLNADFNGWLMGVADGFDDWASGLSATEGFTDFIDYIRTTGPQVAETFGAMFNAVVQFVQATAPLGGPVLAGIEAVSNAIAAIADSDLGTPIMAGVAALALLNRTLAVTASLSKVSLSSGLFAGVGTLSKGVKGQSQSIRADLKDATDGMVAFGANAEKAAAATDRLKSRLATGAGLAGMGVLATGAADGIGLTNTASLALMGTIAGPWGAALGAGTGLLLDWKAAGDRAAESAAAFEASLQTMSLSQLNAELEKSRDIVSGLGDDYGLAAGNDEMEVRSGESDKAAAIEKQIEVTKELEAAEQSRSRMAAMTYASEVGLNTELAVWRRRSVEDIKAQADAFAAVSKEGQATAESFGMFGDSLNDAKVSLGDFITDMQQTANAMVNFNANTRKAVKNGLDDGLVVSLRKAGEEGALRMRQLANASESEIARANRAFRSHERAVQDTVDTTRRLAGMSPLAVKIQAETNPAMNNINALEARLRAIKDETVFVNVRQIGSTTLGPRNEAADGTFVPKTGKPYADRHLYLLADGEGVTTNRRGETDRFKDVISGINAGYSRSMVKGMLAEGGIAGEDRKDGKRKPRHFGAEFVADTSGALEAAIVRLTLVAEDQTKALDVATSRTDEWSKRMEDVAKATISGFSTGLFERGARGTTGGGPLANLMKDIAGLQERSGLQSQLAGLGLSGDALAALLSEGSNADLSGLIASGQTSQYAALYDQRAALQGSVGTAAGQQAFGADFREALKEQQRATAAAQATQTSIAQMQRQMERQAQAIERLEQTGPERTGASVGAAVNGTAAATTRHQGGKTKPKASQR